MPTKKLMYVIWVDSVSPRDCGWMSDEELEEFSKDRFLIEDVGWLQYENKEYICLVGGMGMNQDVLNISHRVVMIPKCSIIKKINLTRHIK